MSCLQEDPLIVRPVASKDTLQVYIFNMKTCHTSSLQQHGLCHFCCLLWSFAQNKMANIQLLFLTFLIAVTRCAWSYAKHDFVRNKEVRLSKIVAPAGKWKQPQWEGLPYVLLSRCKREWRRFIKGIPHRSEVALFHFLLPPIHPLSSPVSDTECPTQTKHNREFWV